MAAYREHITVSSLVGVGYGVFALVVGFTPVQASLAGVLSGIGGMLPDLDSETGTPVRELSALTAAAAPVVLMQHLLAWGGNAERGLLAGVLVYFAVRYGGRFLLRKLTVHRGMFHSVPAMAIAAGAVFFFYRSPEMTVKLLMAGGIAIGFLSHLILDEAYSVEWDGTRVRLKKSAGSALKSVSKSVWANTLTYALLFGTGYACFVQTTGMLPEGVVTEPVAIEELEPAPTFDFDADAVPVAETPPEAEIEGEIMFAEEIPTEGLRRFE